MFPRVPAALAALLVLGSSLAHAQQPDSHRGRADARLANDVCVDHRATPPQGHGAPKHASLYRTAGGRGNRSSAHGAQEAAREACRLQGGQQQALSAGQRRHRSPRETSPKRASPSAQKALPAARGLRLPKVPGNTRAH
jgi:hypothetical protein